MRRFVVIGADTAVGAAVLKHLHPVVSATGLSLCESESIPDICRQATDIVLCGNASESSWDHSFGDFDQDERLVPCYCRLAAESKSRFVYVSSDVVFDGPWIFHDDDTPLSHTARHGRQLQQLERCVFQSADNLVVRTNALAHAPDGFLNRLRESMLRPGRITVRSDLYSTPLATERMAAMLAVVLNTDAAGTLHLGGAERLSPFSFAVRLAAAETFDRSLLIPTAESAPREQSLRCTRALAEFQLRMPTLSQTLEDLAESESLTQLQAA